MEVKAYVNGFQVVHSGIIHIAGNSAQLNVEGLPVNIMFVEDEGGQRWENFGDGSVVNFKIYNVSGSLPEGVLEPIQFASNPGGIFSITFISALIDRSRRFRTFEYTILYKEKTNG
jgi:hypothetical protein